MSKSFFTFFIDIFFSVIIVVIFIRILLSWIRTDFEHPVAKIIFDLTEPFLSLFRKILPQSGPLDFSPLLAMIALELARELILFLIKSI